MIDEESYKVILFDYAVEKYGKQFQEFHDEFYDEFPYKLEDAPDDLYLENFVAWLVFEKPIPATGKTIVEEFVDQHPDNGGYVKYGKLKGYDDELTFWWKEEPPTSTIGILRLNALLALGKMPMSGRMFRVALIPVDIRDDLQTLL